MGENSEEEEEKNQRKKKLTQPNPKKISKKQKRPMNKRIEASTLNKSTKP